MKTKELPTVEELWDIFYYDLEGFLVWKNGKRKGRRAGNIRPRGYRYIRLRNDHDRCFYFEHRLIFKMFNGFDPNVVDHLDRNPSNNKFNNLRSVSHTQNIVNSKLRVTNKSGYRNVYWDKSIRRWVVKIDRERKVVHHSIHKDKAEAIQVAKDKLKELDSTVF